MRHRSPHDTGSAGSHGGDPSGVPVDEDEPDLRWHVRARAHAVLVETSSLEQIDWDSVAVIAEGIAEEIRAAT